jgi:sRNA-binding carbon storage regulator CsrA
MDTEKPGFLVLQRSVGESIIITVAGHRVVVMLTDVIGGRRARIGVSAARAVRIMRSEVEGRDGEA